MNSIIPADYKSRREKLLPYVASPFGVLLLWRKDRDSSWILQGMSADFILGALQNPSVTAKNSPPDCFLNAASNPCYIPSAIENGRRLASFFYGGKTGIRTLEAVLALTRFPVVRLRPTQPSFHSRLPVLLFTFVRSIPHIL